MYPHLLRMLGEACLYAGVYDHFDAVGQRLRDLVFVLGAQAMQWLGATLSTTQPSTQASS